MHIEYSYKKFYCISNTKQKKENNILFYYCNNHNTTKYSRLFYKNGTKK